MRRTWLLVAAIAVGIPGTGCKKKMPAVSADRSAGEAWEEGQYARRGEDEIRDRDPAYAAAHQARKIHHDAHAEIRTPRPDALFAAVSAIAEAHGGSTWTLTADRVVIAVPVDAFEAAWVAVQALGPVADSSVSSTDVTDRYVAVDLRLETLRRARDRLIALLGKATTDAERLDLLAEIQRTSEQVEQFEAELRTLQGLAELSTISVAAAPVAAVARVQDVATEGLAWVDRLDPQRRHEVGPRVAVEVPEGFVLLADRGPLSAASADGAWLWTGSRPNEPVGTPAFWADAIADRHAADHLATARVVLGRWTCERFTAGDDLASRWDVCVAVDGPTLEVLQVLLPSAAHVARYGDALDRALRGGDA